MANRQRRADETYEQYKSHLRLEQESTEFLLKPRLIDEFIPVFWRDHNNKRLNILAKRLYIKWA